MIEKTRKRKISKYDKSSKLHTKKNCAELHERLREVNSQNFSTIREQTNRNNIENKSCIYVRNNI